MKNLSSHTVFERTFILEKLPEPLTRASEHLQCFDNFIDGTRLCLRTIRSPKTKEWTWILEQRFPHRTDDFSTWTVSRIYLNAAEHQVFEQFEGREVSNNERVETNEVRYNRYLFEDQQKFEIDVYLGKEIWGLIVARIYFDTPEEMNAFEAPFFAKAELTQNEFFIGGNLIAKTFADVQAEFTKMLAGGQKR